MRKTVAAVMALLAALLLSEIDASSCTTVIVGAKMSATGRPLIWKQRDTSNPFNVVVHIPASDTSLAYTGIFSAKDTLRRRVYAGANSAGFAIVNNATYNLASEKYDPQNGEFMRMALEKCKTLLDFEYLAQTIPHPRNIAGNFAVADATGAAAYYEIADIYSSRFDVRPDGYAIRTNFSLSGKPDGGSGLARFQTAEFLMAQHKGKFTPCSLIEELGRSYHNAILGYDASKTHSKGMAYDEDFIPRPTTTCSVCIDGGEVIWVASGYTPACFAVPVWVEAENEMPSCIKPSKFLDGSSPANCYADSLKRKMHPLTRDAAKKYIDFKVEIPVHKNVTTYEEKVVKMTRGVMGKMHKKGFDKAKVAELDSRIDAAFAEFKAIKY